MTGVNLRASIRLTASSRVPPARVRLWKSGNNPGDFGDCFFTPTAAERVMAEAQLRGVSKVLDIEHGLNPAVNPNPDPNNPPVTGGYFDLELAGPSDAPELWIVPRWSDCGRDAPTPGMVCCATHQITSGQREYLSPDWDLDPETREPIRLNRVSLVAEPGTYGISMLASRRAANQKASKPMNEIDSLRAAYAGNMALAKSSNPKLAASAAATCEEIKAALGALGIDVEKAPEAEAAPEGAEAEAAPTSEKKEGEPPMAAAAPPPPAAEPEKAPVAARASAEKPLTASALNLILAERDERAAMAADPRVTPAMKNVIAKADLKTAREIIKALPVAPAPTGTENKDGPVNHVASKAKFQASLSQTERFTADRIQSALELTVENVTAARKLMEADPDGEGSVAVSLKSLVEKHKARRNPAQNAMRFGV